MLEKKPAATRKSKIKIPSKMERRLYLFTDLNKWCVRFVRRCLGVQIVKVQKILQISKQKEEVI